MLDISNEAGTIAPGKTADMIGVDSSPLDNVTALERVSFVMSRGDVFKSAK